jgi:transcriptional regulator with XRE-family HTH domain
MWVYQSQFEFADTLGLSARAYANYERGEREMPAALLLRLYELFNVDPVWVLTGTATAKDAVVPQLRNHRQRALTPPARWRHDDFHVVPEGGQAVEQSALGDPAKLPS